MRFVFCPGLALIVLSFCGCGNNGRIPTYSVKGSVFVDGQPAKEAFVTFHPRVGEPGKTLIPSAKVDETGAFSVSTYVAGDGAPAGEYDVTIKWPVRYNPISTLWEGDKLKGRYSNPQKTELKVTVEQKATELQPFKLTTGAASK